MSSHYNSYFSKLFEPILVDIIGEDGNGTLKLSISGEILNKANKIVSISLSELQLSIPNTHISVNMNNIFSFPVFTRGTIYFSNLFRLMRIINAYDPIYSNEKLVHNIISTILL